ncbi:hypothetical protein BP6252_08980 [Coleophoma cylindrospora]|uniref:Aspartate aminotransferase n=1 Tax=Coleophoma cylindrospora TaxID=1849047 RepID=A0A3D8R174_9HELO|nr:hypothetical protein BP6252_08980 [Coleophoma cylindrospora]
MVIRHTAKDDSGSYTNPEAVLASQFASLPPVASDEVFDLIGAYLADAYPERVNLGAGVYRTADGKPWPLASVEQAEKLQQAANDPGRHEYLPIAGDQEFLKLARDLVFASGASGWADQKTDELRIASVQTVSGTGANHVGALFLAHHSKAKHVWISDPTWINHHTIWELAGVERRLYPYYKASDCSFDFDGMIKALDEEAERNDIVLLHACAHNPTGIDPSKEQWKAIAEVCQRKGLFPFFDSAYQGFASGDPAEDAWCIQYFFEQKPSIEMCVAQSFSKNFGLYGQRAGAFHLVTSTPSAEIRDGVVAGLSHIIRGEFSMAPRFGSSIVKTILQSEALTTQWMDDLQVMSGRIKTMRESLYNELIKLNTPGTWTHIVNQIGMFSYTGLTVPQIKYLREKYHIYMLVSGRISISGLTPKNVEYVAIAINDAVQAKP